MHVSLPCNILGIADERCRAAHRPDGKRYIFDRMRSRNESPPCEDRCSSPLNQDYQPMLSPATKDIFARYGLSRIINASGTETNLGASPVADEVIQSVAELVGHSVNMAELQSVACSLIAAAFDAEAGCVVNCSAAGISIAVAACMTGTNLARVERLPDARDMKNAVVLQRGHNINYGAPIPQNVAITGARLVEIGAATECAGYQLEEALNPDTAAALYVVSHHTVQSGLIDLKTFCRICHAAHVPVIVDAAAEPDPRVFIEAGADLVIVSMQKSFAGLTAGVIAGSLGLVRACMFQEKGIGRPMKVGKEGVIGAIAAIERWVELDRNAIRRTLDERLGNVKRRLEILDGLRVTLEPDGTSASFDRLNLRVDPARAGLTAHELSRALWSQRPAIAVRSLRADRGLIEIDLRRASPEQVDHIVSSIEKILGTQPPRGSGKRKTGKLPPATSNSADHAASALERWPLPIDCPTKSLSHDRAKRISRLAR
jgi:L-seryl-tRNA(Ser) seleniumtransferase